MCLAWCAPFPFPLDHVTKPARRGSGGNLYLIFSGDLRHSSGIVSSIPDPPTHGPLESPRHSYRGRERLGNGAVAGESGCLGQSAVIMASAEFKTRILRTR